MVKMKHFYSYFDIPDDLEIEKCMNVEGEYNMGEYKLFIDPLEFQKKVIDYTESDEFDKMVEKSFFSDDPKCKQAVAHGMYVAALLTSRCNLHYQNGQNPNVLEKG